MNKIKTLAISVLLLWTSLIYADASNISEHSPIGYWKTMDDVTGKPKAIVQIFATPNKVLLGKIVKIFSKEDAQKRCTACEGNRYDQPILGMLIMEKLEPSDKNEWNNGNILDPKNGKIYRCSVRLTENGQKLSVHGYIGLPLFGRSQTWIRAESTEPA